MLGEINSENFDAFDQFVQNELAEIETNQSFYETYVLNQTHTNGNLLRAYGMSFKNEPYTITAYADYSLMEEAEQNVDYTITSGSVYTITQLKDIILFIQPNQDEALEITTGSNTYQLLPEDIANNELGYFYIYLLAGQTAELSSSFNINDSNKFWVYKPLFTPFVQLRVFPNEVPNTQDLSITAYERVINESDFEETNVYIEPSDSFFYNTYSFDTAVTELTAFTKQNNPALSKILTGSVQELTSNSVTLGKYFYKLTDGILEQRTYAISSDYIIEADEQTEGFQVNKHYTQLYSEYDDGAEYTIPLKLCTPQDLRISFLFGSNGTVVNLPAERNITKTTMQSYGVGENKPFILIAVADQQVQALWFENIQQFPNMYRLNFQPQMLAAVQDLSGQLMSASSSTELIINNPCILQLITTNNSANDVLTFIDQDDTQSAIGGSQDSIVKVFSPNMFEHTKYTVQNNSDQDQVFVQIQLEYYSLTTPSIALQSGYTYSLSVIEEDGTEKEFVTTQLTDSNIDDYLINKRASWKIELTSASAQFQLTNALKLTKMPIDQTSDKLAFTFAKNINRIIDITAKLKPQTLYSGYISLVNRRELYEL